MKVLFTCVGKSDPLTIFENNVIYDAAYMQIARYHCPDKIYFYMSKEICEFDEIDNRYEKSIMLLNRHLNTKIETYKIKRPELIDVQRFDEFYDDFENIINEIIIENGKDVEILCNVSSGTPAMKATLQILAALSKYKLTPIQVDDPTKGKWQRDVDLKNYDLDFYWELNSDNDINEDRTYFSKNDKFNFKIQKELLVNLIKSSDYEAAYDLVNSYKYRIDKNVIDLIKFSLDRYNLDTKEILKSPNKSLLPYLDEEQAKIFEYGLWLKVKIEKGEILDFVRGINPFLYEICKYTLNNICKINILKYCHENKKNGVMYLTRQLMDKDSQGKELLNILDSEFSKYKNRFLSEKQMLTILYAKLDDDSELQLSLERLDSLRKKIRNIASHQITCVREEDIIKKLGKSVDDYVNIIRIVLACLNFDTSKYWDSYNLMNKKIIEEINELR
ncbi:type III-A CRISPR-associated CARF protein Csm6 [Thomasclavelia spiroformis]|uniref:type III-A CRISPR-associated CARF protein Csm6 n=1 Tax=Thomasclavelia spiroformis TaxID=29348 RepID=UPI003990D6DD